MTILSIAQACAQRLQLISPTTFIGSTDNNMILLKAIIEQTLGDISDCYPWPELQKEYTFSLVTSQASYALPGDFDRQQFETLWNRSQHWPLLGPIDPVQWQTYKSGLVTTLPNQRIRVKGWTDKQFFVDPTPDSGVNGQTCVFEYIIKTNVRPATWVASSAVGTRLYCSYNGNIYSKPVGAPTTTGTTAPTHTSGSVSDGSITWTYVSATYAVTYDDDVPLLDEQMIIDGAEWRFRRSRGFAYMALKKDAEDKIDMLKTNLTGAGVVSINGGDIYPLMIGYPYSYPVSNY